MFSISKLVVTVGLVCAMPTSAMAVVHIDIDLNSQTMHVDSDSGASYDWSVSTGRPGHRTPRGTFRPQAMYTMVHSAKYDNAPMPHSIFFTGGYAIHGTFEVGSLGHVASHGCVRLAPGNAATLFAMVKEEGAVISIGGGAHAGEYVAEAASPHRARHRLAAAQRKRLQEKALAYATPHRTRTLREWARNPLGVH
ncbi:MAG TPA: L,D-transpeptidase [Roseiarcus sp.]